MVELLNPQIVLTNTYTVSLNDDCQNAAFFTGTFPTITNANFAYVESVIFSMDTPQGQPDQVSDDRQENARNRVSFVINNNNEPVSITKDFDIFSDIAEGQYSRFWGDNTDIWPQESNGFQFEVPIDAYVDNDIDIDFTYAPDVSGRSAGHSFTESQTFDVDFKLSVIGRSV